MKRTQPLYCDCLQRRHPSAASSKWRSVGTNIFSRKLESLTSFCREDISFTPFFALCSYPLTSFSVISHPSKLVYSLSCRFVRKFTRIITLTQRDTIPVEAFRWPGRLSPFVFF